MRYTTTKCSKCGYATRIHESNTPDFQIGMPIIKCPKCGGYLVDPIVTEYEFLRARERASLKESYKKSIISNIVFILIGYVAPVVGFMASGEIAAIGYIIPACTTVFGLIGLIKNAVLENNGFTTKLKYYSLKRTSNREYVDFLVSAYRQMGIRRTYMRYGGRDEFMKENEGFEKEGNNDYEAEMKEYEALLAWIPPADDVIKSDENEYNTP